MSDAPTTTKRKISRSPGYPGISLPEAVSKIRVLWERENKHPVDVSVLISHWQYAAKSSGGRIAVAAAIKFGLLDGQDSSGGRQVRLTDRAMQILLGEPDRKAGAIKEAALAPKIYRQMWERFGSELPSNESLTNRLILEYEFNPVAISGFIKDYKDTIAFAGLKAGDTADTPGDEDEDESAPELPLTGESKPVAVANDVQGDRPREINNGGHPDPTDKVLARYKIPLGTNVAELIFTGEELVPDDFDALSDYVQIFKKQFERKLKATERKLPPTPIAAPMSVNALSPAVVPTQFPVRAIWHNNDSDIPVTITGIMGEKNGEMFYSSEGGTGLPAGQLEFDS